MIMFARFNRTSTDRIGRTVMLRRLSTGRATRLRATRRARFALRRDLGRGKAPLALLAPPLWSTQFHIPGRCEE